MLLLSSSQVKASGDSAVSRWPGEPQVLCSRYSSAKVAGVTCGPRHYSLHKMSLCQCRLFGFPWSGAVWADAANASTREQHGAWSAKESLQESVLFFLSFFFFTAIKPVCHPCISPSQHPGGHSSERWERHPVPSPCVREGNVCAQALKGGAGRVSTPNLQELHWEWESSPCP